MNKIKTFSFGGLGDSYIVYLKLLQRQIETNKVIDHIFIESNEKVPKSILYLHEYKTNAKIHIDACCVGDYQRKYLSGESGPWDDREPLNTSVDGTYFFPIQDEGIKNEYALLNKKDNSKYDSKKIIIQVSAGINNNRCWKFHPNILANILRKQGYEVFLVGNNLFYKDLNDPFNLVGKVDLNYILNEIKDSKLYIGLSGFLTYYSLSYGVLNIHNSESKEHDKHYIHPEWEQNRFRIEYASMAEVMKGLKYYGIL